MLSTITWLTPTKRPGLKNSMSEPIKNSTAGPSPRKSFSKSSAVVIPNGKEMVLAGLYIGGSRLGDVADLKWEYIDLATREIRFQTEKTDRPKPLPIAGPLYWY